MYIMSDISFIFLCLNPYTTIAADIGVHS